MSKSGYILGGSGHALVVGEIIRLNGLTLAGYFDLNRSAVMPSDLPFMGKESAETLQKYATDSFFFPAVGNNELRSKLTRLLSESGFMQLAVIHPGASVSDSAQIGLSTMVGPRAVINPLAEIGAGVIINSGTIVEHECVVADFCHIAPGATLLGNVLVGTGSFIGANSVVKQGVRIGANVTIGAGSVVLRDVPDNCIMAGNPARLLK